MPTEVEKDAVTGQETTGHEWDGIKELNSPLPRWWLYVLYARIAWSVGYWVLYPAIPGLTGYTKGLIGGSAREALDERLAAARARQAGYLDRIEAASLEEIRADADLLAFAQAGGQAAFADNCAPCHGLGGAGQRGFPNLADDSWLWGGTLEEIHTTVLYGIRSGHDEARFSDMPAFGADQLLSREEIEQVADYVLSLSGEASAAPGSAELFADNCAACHGEQGEGMIELGAPALNDQIWLYGGDRDAIIAHNRALAETPGEAHGGH